MLFICINETFRFKPPLNLLALSYREKEVVFLLFYLNFVIIVTLEICAISLQHLISYRVRKKRLAGNRMKIVADIQTEVLKELSPYK